MLAREYIEKIKQSAQRALDDLDREDEHGIRLALGDLDYVEHRLEAAKILLREELRNIGNSK